jgi:PAS domain-containing protein
LKSSVESKSLLLESQQATHQLASQEEEMRQNLEELQATQEEMERIQRELQNRNELVEQIFFLFETDTRKNISAMTERTLQLLRYQKGELVGQSIFNVVEGELALAAGFRIMDSGNVWSDEIELRTKNNINIWIHISGSAILRRNESIEKYAFIFSDITHNKHQEKMLTEKNEELVRVRKAEQERVNAMISNHKKATEKLTEELQQLKVKPNSPDNS